VQIAVADAGRRDADAHLACTRIVQVDVGDLDRLLR
jgi:hypothetical protein